MEETRNTATNKGLRKSNINMNAVILILTSVILLCEFPENIMHNISDKNPECKFHGSSLFGGGGNVKTY